ncbi:MAG: hypothetical protein EAZ43_12195 [Betaproteobacteria bacterium]|nr:MAG: hypothetical protein EAZ43_12195 [Betaproteobacteria bacterium]
MGGYFNSIFVILGGAAGICNRTITLEPLAAIKADRAVASLAWRRSDDSLNRQSPTKLFAIGRSA